jgi:hypothetical protein
MFILSTLIPSYVFCRHMSFSLALLASQLCDSNLLLWLLWSHFSVRWLSVPGGAYSFSSVTFKLEEVCQKLYIDRYKLEVKLEYSTQ